MKTLVVIRHAKSSWNNPELSDYDRPLNERGQRDAPRMGKRLLSKGLTPQLMLTSPAKRALNTCQLIAHEVGYDIEGIEQVDDLYHADAEDILEQVRSISDNFATVFLFGHNPGLTDFVNALADERIDNIPTTGTSICKMNITHWKDAAWGCATLTELDYPKKVT